MPEEIYNFEAWINIVEPLPGESISHFLGRFEMANLLTGYQVGKDAGVGAIVTRWKKLYFNPFPTQQELEALANFVEVEVEELKGMLPLKGMTMKPRPIKLCAVCYAEEPYHRIEWQYKEQQKCVRHNLRLLTKCTNCETPFPIPADWVKGECPHCFLPFAKMAKRQQRY
ncbi:TniQ family protein [Aliinostoc sp. HNIBRCY26]|uniref:TniQ family protein n=1 Tax=Aliinostoc sp. HNIBRCY26 TaxID=3418997 RepID=UPI003D06B230